MCGAQHVDEASQSDPVVVRADGSYLYSFTALVDDIDFGITHLILGEDNVTNTGAQIQMFSRWAPVAPVIEDGSLLAEAADRLPAEPWDEASWKGWTSALGRRGGPCSTPLRLALTARETGPEMAKLLPLIGRGPRACPVEGAKRLV